MSVELATGYVSIVPSARGLQANLQRQMGGPAAAAGAAGGRTMGGALAGGVLGAVRKMMPAAAAVVAGIGVARMGSEMVGVANQATRTEASLSALYGAAGHGAGEATRATEMLFDTFGRSALGMEVFQKGAESLAYLGLNASDSVGVMTFLEDAILATGGGTEQMTRVTEALTSAQNRGKATMMELNRISAAGVPILDMLSEHLGVTTGEVMEMASAGEISIDDLTAVLQSTPGQWAPALREGADEVRKTLPVAWDSAKNSIINSVAQNIIPLVNGLAPVVTRAGELVTSAVDKIPAVFDAARDAIGWVSDAVDTVAESFRSATDWAREHSTAVGVAAGIIGTMLLPTLVSAAVSFAGLVAGWAAAGVAAAASAARQVGAWLLVRANQIASIAVLGVANALTVASWIQMGVTAMANAVRIAAAWVLGHVTGAAAAMASFAVSVATTVAGWVRMGVQSMLQGARMAAAWVLAMGPVGWIIATVVALVALIVANWDTVVEWTSAAWSWVTDRIGAAWSWITDTTSTAVAAVVGFFTDLRDRAVELVGNLRDRVVDFVGGMRDRAVSTVTGMRDSAVAAVTGLRDRAVSAVANLRDRVASTFGEARSRVVNIATDLRDRVVGFFVGLYTGAVEQVTAVVDRAKQIKDDVVGFFANAGTWLLNAGRAIMRGLRDGITDMAMAPVRAAERAVDRVRNLLPGSPVKEGPLRVLNRGYAGGQIVSMIADGMTGNLGVLTSAADAAARAALVDVGTAGVPAVAAMRPASAVHAASVDGYDSAGVGSSGPATFNLYDHDGVLIGSMRGVQADDARTQARRLRQSGVS